MQVLAVQYRRGRKRLQIIVLPYKHTVSTACLIRFTSLNDEVDPLRQWRTVGIYGLEQTIEVEGLEAFNADVAVESVFTSEWVTGEKTVMEAKALVDIDATDAQFTIASRVPSSLIAAIRGEIDIWV